MLNVERERLYRTLSRQVSELTPDRRRALSSELKRMTAGRLTDALRKAIAQSDRTPAAIAWDADVNPSQVYRFLEGGTIKLATADRLAELLGLDLTHAATTKKAKPALAKRG